MRYNMNIAQSIEEHMGFIIKIVERFKPKSNEEYDRLVQAGRIGLWRALLGWDETRGYQFTTYAWRPIYWEILRERQFVDSFKYMDINDSVATMEDDTLTFEQCQCKLDKDEATVIDMIRYRYKYHEIADYLKVNTSQVKRIYEKAMRKLKKANGKA